MTTLKEETCPECGDKFSDYFGRPDGEERCQMCACDDYATDRDDEE